MRKGVYRRVYTGLTENSSYSFLIRTYDSAGNASDGKTVGAFTAKANVFPSGSGYSIPLLTGTLNFDVDAGGNVTIKGASTMTDLIIPASIGGHPVTNLADALFGWRSDIVSVVFPDSITSISKQAFDCCYNLQSAELPANLNTIGFKAFNDCGYLTSLTIPASVTNIGDGAFYNCGGLIVVNVYPNTPPP